MLRDCYCVSHSDCVVYCGVILCYLISCPVVSMVPYKTNCHFKVSIMHFLIKYTHICTYTHTHTHTQGGAGKGRNDFAILFKDNLHLMQSNSSSKQEIVKKVCSYIRSSDVFFFLILFPLLFLSQFLFKFLLFSALTFRCLICIRLYAEHK